MKDLDQIIQMDSKPKILTSENMDSSVSEKKFEEIEEGLNFFNRGKLQKQVVRKYFEAQEVKWEQLLDLYYKAWLIKKEVELKILSQNAVKYTIKLEREHRELMEQVALEDEQKVMSLLYNFGVMVSKQLQQAINSEELMEDIKKDVIEAIRYRKEITFDKIRNGLDSFINSLDKKYQAQKTKKLKAK